MKKREGMNAGAKFGNKKGRNPKTSEPASRRERPDFSGGQREKRKIGGLCKGPGEKKRKRGK